MRKTKDDMGRVRELNLNKLDTEKYAKNLSSFTNLDILMVIHILELYYQITLYDIKDKILDNNYDNIKIEIPFIGGLYLKLEDDKFVFDHFEFEYEFEDDLKNILETKECKLESMIKDKYLEKILSKYEELL